MLELFRRREISLFPAGTKTNELIAKHMHTRRFVVINTIIIILVT